MNGLSADEITALLLSAKVSGWSTLLCLFPGVVLGWLLARRDFVLKPALEAFIFLPMVLPPTVPGYLLLVLFGAQGVVGRWLTEHWGISLVFNWKGAVLASAIIAFPFMVQAVKLSVQLIDRRIEQAASTLGASPLKVWFTITLPLIFPGILAGLVMVFCRSLGEFGATMTFVGNIEGETRTLPLAIYSATHQMGGEAVAYRLIAISILFAFVALLVSHAFTRRAEKKLGISRA